MNGNFSRSYVGGAPLHQQNSQGGSGCFLSGRTSQMGGQQRNFSTSRNYNGKQSPSKGYTLPPANESYHANPRGFLNGIKNMVNGFIYPKLNCDFYSDHNRHFNPKYRKNYMMDRKLPLPAPAAIANNCTTSNLKPVVIGLETYHNTMRPQKETKEISDPNIVAIFTRDDFPELPARKNPPTWKFSPKGKCSYFEGKTKSRDKCKPKVKLNQPTMECDGDFVVLSKNTSPTKICSPFAMAATTTIKTEPTSSSLSPIATPPSPTSSSIGIKFGCRSRMRQISECSDDSFVICFTDDAPEGVLEAANDSDEFEFTCDEDDDDDDDDDDEDIDETDNHIRNLDKTKQPDSGFEEKKVRFNLKPTVHVMYSWNYAYRAARKGHWENYAIDRQRFKRRIDNLNEILSPILDTQHRERIYRTRFCDSDKAISNEQSSTT